MTKMTYLPHILKKLSDYLRSLPYQICRLLELQIFINLLSLPILLSWGLPLSLLSPIGNIIFAPWLTLFLMLSSLLFFAQLLSIPNEWIAYLLERLNDIFFAILNRANASCMISCPCPPTIVLILIPFIIFSFLGFMRKHFNLYRRVIALLFFTLSLFLILKYVFNPKDHIEYVSNTSKKILLLARNQKHIIVDLGALSEGRNPQSWVKFHLISHLIKQGAHSIDSLIILHASPKIWKSIAELLPVISIKKIYIQGWNGKTATYSPAVQSAIERIKAASFSAIELIPFTL